MERSGRAGKFVGVIRIAIHPSEVSLAKGGQESFRCKLIHSFPPLNHSSIFISQCFLVCLCHVGSISKLLFLWLQTQKNWGIHCRHFPVASSWRLNNVDEKVWKIFFHFKKIFNSSKTQQTLTIDENTLNNSRFPV